MTMHNEWTDKLSDYLDDELEDSERAAVEGVVGSRGEARPQHPTAASEPRGDRYDQLARRGGRPSRADTGVRGPGPP